jgi:hypothetical protein
LWGYLAANNLALDNVEAGRPCPASNGEQPIAECGVVVKITILSMYPYTIVTVPYIVTTKYYCLITSTAIG